MANTTNSKKTARPATKKSSKKKAPQKSFYTASRNTKALKIGAVAFFALVFGFLGLKLLRGGFSATPTLTVATWNAKIDNTNNVATQTKTILGTASVVGLQEIHRASQRDNIYKMIQSDSYAVSPKAHAGNTNNAGVESYPIVWREKEFYRTKEGAIGPVTDSLPGLRPRYITWVRLKQRATGKEFIVVNTHMLKDVEVNGSLSSNDTNIKQYGKHMAKLTSLLKSLKSQNVPIFMTGDFAANYRKDSGRVSIFPKAAYGPLGITSSYQMTTLEGISSSQKTYGASNRLIDYVFAWKGKVTPISNWIGKSTYGSDHYPVFYKVTLSPPSSTTM